MASIAFGRMAAGIFGIANFRRASRKARTSSTPSPIAPALAQHPKVVLADEPVASLDPEAAEDIMRLLRRLAGEERLAVLCVLHQVELAYAYADRVVGIRDGRMAFDLPCAEVSRDAVKRLYMSEAA